MGIYISRSVLEYARDLVNLFHVNQFEGSFQLYSKEPSYVVELDPDTSCARVVLPTALKGLKMVYQGVCPSLEVSSGQTSDISHDKIMVMSTHSEISACETEFGVDVDSLTPVEHNDVLDLIDRADWSEVPVSYLAIEYLCSLMYKNTVFKEEGWISMNRSGVRVWHRGIGIETFWTGSECYEYYKVPLPALYYDIAVEGGKSASRLGVTVSFSENCTLLGNTVPYGRNLLWSGSPKKDEDSVFALLSQRWSRGMCTVHSSSAKISDDMVSKCREVTVSTSGKGIDVTVLMSNGDKATAHCDAEFATSVLCSRPMKVMNGDILVMMLKEGFDGTVSLYQTDTCGHTLVFETNCELGGLFSLARPQNADGRRVTTRVYFSCIG